MKILIIIATIGCLLYLAHYLSYCILKKRILKQQKWGLNICCGKTDGGGVNADIFMHTDVPSFQLIEDIYNLPFEDKQFDSILCSHTIEHVEDPLMFFNELQRVGKEVTIVVPPLWDLCAVFNIFEHRRIFLSFRKKHNRLPRYVRLPVAIALQRKIGQVINA
ncbi:class I SAM-dependent methyltransferase [Alkaliphilus pronyensis]|uniref:Class I SAM-dependent methyltransferase n=1 Tax=Alkaliphilus pronyensis TaxID=1482732 RepID=A0A6I0FAE4_9FIRM|nr:methyltransferase domain-containing protein [Alkaliphilus pronyensis]KAB3535743.1 class I SAM-dependent methyltransferase [Alkaliphilus pronyensis]